MPRTRFWHRLRNELVQVAGSIDVVRRRRSKRAIDKLASAAPVRPRPISMAADYPTWQGLTDRGFSGRHLPRDTTARQRPTVAQVKALFESDGDVRATDTSLLFPFFAQWFTDSFLRTRAEGEMVRGPDGTETFVPYDDPPIPADGSKPPEFEVLPSGEIKRYRTYKYNDSNHEIDLCQIYGMNEAETKALRLGQGGLLKSQGQEGQEFPPPLFVDDGSGRLVRDPQFEILYGDINFHRVYDLGLRGLDASERDRRKRNAYAVGLEHGNSTVGNVLMNILFLREHNRVARALQAAYRDWDDERLFQTARNVCIVELLKIVIQDYIVHISPLDFPLMYEPGSGETEDWYRTNWIPVEFALLYRWHSLIPETVTFAGQTQSADKLRWNTDWLKTVGVDAMCLDASKQAAGKLGIRGNPAFLSGITESSIVMSRVCGLAPYNAYREAFGLDALRSFGELTDDPNVQSLLKRYYGTVDNLEWYVGIFAESYDAEDMMGDLMVQMVANDAFTQACTNPLLAEAVYTNALTFSEVGLDILENTNSLADVVVRNTGIADKGKIGFNYRRVV